jgi:hypothetical protein
MAKLYNLARMTTATTGTGTITLGSAVSGYLSFASAGVQDGDTVTYAIKDGSSSEIGEGVYTASGTTLTRSVIKSTNSNSAINLSGSAEVFITPSHRHFMDSGTLMLFQQTSAPTGWTKQTTHNDKALRVVSGTASSGGSSAFSTVFGKTATDATTLTSATVPAHSHGFAGGGSNLVTLDQGGVGQWASGTGVQYNVDSTTTTVGSGGSHTHGMDIRVQYVDLIIAQKD